MKVSAILLATLISGCASYTVNAPLQKSDRTTGYKERAVEDKKNSNTLWVGLAFSGGGTRSAAFSFGLLEQLKKTEILWDGKRRRLLDEVDSISSVSGGSFTAAYFALFGKRIFDDFEEKFLKRDIEAGILGRILSPVNWFRLFSEGYSRADLAADYYDEILFEGKTFGDLEAKGKPFISINATDMSNGFGFTFNQDYFDAICSDISKFPISRAVTASSAFPVVFTPISLRSYAGSCDYQLPPWVKEELDRRDPFSRRFHLAKIVQKYRDPEKTKFIHLLDGGVSDNLGLRTAITTYTAKNPWKRLKQQGLEKVRRVVIIVADAKSSPEKDWPRRPSVSGIVQMLDASTSSMVDNYSFETLLLFRRRLNEWAEVIKTKRCQDMPSSWCDDLKVHLVALSFDSLKDESERKFFTTLPTRLDLPEETVDQVRRVAEKLLKQSPEFQKIMQELDGKER